MEVRLVRSEGRAEGLRAFAERERTLRATNEPEKGARRAAVRAAEVAKRQPTRELERETGNVARWKAAKAARGRGRKVAERDDVARAARERACEAAAVAAVDAEAEAAGRRSGRVTFRRTHAAVAKRGASGVVGDIKALSWDASRMRRAAVAPVDMPVAGDGWQQAPDGLEYTRVPARRWAKRTPTDTTVVLASAVVKRERETVARWKAAKAARVTGGARARDAGTAAEIGAVEGRRRQRVAFAAETMPVPTGVKVSNKHCRTAAVMLASREAVMESIRETRAGAMERTLCENTVGGIDSAWRLWLIFCPIRGVDPDTFGQLEHDELPRPSQLMEEDQTFADFGCFAVENPRKAGLTHLQGSTAAAYISRVMTRYEGILQPPRRPGVAAGLAGANNQLGHALRRTLKGLKKMYPGNKKKGRKAAVVRSMMMAVKAQLDLTDPYEAMIWAYCCTCWQGGRRSGELVRGKARTGRWDPEFDMHRGRVSNELGEDGTVQRTVIALAPDKTDVTGEEGHEALLPMSYSAEINAAAAIEHMLRLDPTPSRVAAQDVPLFRDVRKGGKAMTYGAVRLVVTKLLINAGMTKEEAGTHSFRRGCATSLRHVGASDSTSRAVGIWASNAMHGYMDVTVGGDMERSMLAMAEADVRVRPAASGRGID